MPWFTPVPHWQVQSFGITITFHRWPMFFGALTCRKLLRPLRWTSKWTHASLSTKAGSPRPSANLGETCEPTNPTYNQQYNAFIESIGCLDSPYTHATCVYKYYVYICYVCAGTLFCLNTNLPNNTWSQPATTVRIEEWTLASLFLNTYRQMQEKTTVLLFILNYNTKQCCQHKYWFNECMNTFIYPLGRGLRHTQCFNEGAQLHIEEAIAKPRP